MKKLEYDFFPLNALIMYLEVLRVTLTETNMLRILYKSILYNVLIIYVTSNLEWDQFIIFSTKLECNDVLTEDHP